MSEVRRPTRIILDCDPGHDDAIAMLLAAGSPAIELLAITTVAGNQTLDKVTRNARAVATLAGIEAPIAAGCDRPLVRPLQVAADIHGASGLDGPELPTPTIPLDPRHGVDLIVELVMTHEPGTITLVPIGPLTNVAMAVRREPRIAERVAEVVLMGGSAGRGNQSPAAEFNIMVDPEAARIVFEAGWPVTMVGLDATHQALATPDVISRIAQIGTPLAAVVVELLNFFATTYREQQGFEYPPVHDPVAVARVIDPALVATRPAFIQVECESALTYGMTVTDFDGYYGRPLAAQVATGIDHGGFWDLVIAALHRLG